MKQSRVIILTGVVIGLAGALLMWLGNPANMGLCLACFWRDVAGGLGLHRAGVVQNIRLEIVGFILGAFVIANLVKGEYKVQSGSSPFTRFFLGAAMMIGALVFLGCPWRMVLRLSGGDWTAISGLFGFIAGVYLATEFLKKGFSLGRASTERDTKGYLFPAIAVGLLLLRLINPEFIFLSESGPGSQFAPLWITLIVGLIIGALAQRSRICSAGAIRDVILVRDFDLFKGMVAIIVVATGVNMALGQFTPGFTGQAVAHTDYLWNFLGMFIVGIAAIMLGGCPLRQTILAGEGNIDSVIAVFGMVFGAAISHNFGLAGSPDGVGFNGRAATIGLIIALLILAWVNITQNNKEIATRRREASSNV